MNLAKEMRAGCWLWVLSLLIRCVMVGSQADLCDEEACERRAHVLGLPFSVQETSNGAPAGCIRYNDGRVSFVESCEDHPNCGTSNCNGCRVLGQLCENDSYHYYEDYGDYEGYEDYYGGEDEYYGEEYGDYSFDQEDEDAEDSEFCSEETCEDEAFKRGLPFSEQAKSNGAPAGCIQYNDGRIIFVRTCSNHPNCGTKNCNGCKVLWELCQNPTRGPPILVIVVAVVVPLVVIVTAVLCFRARKRSPDARASSGLGSQSFALSVTSNGRPGSPMILVPTGGEPSAPTMPAKPMIYLAQGPAHSGRSLGPMATSAAPAPIPDAQGPTRQVDYKKAASLDSPTAQAEKECSICLVNPKTHAFTPCGHMCVCESCSSLVTVCPLCRSATSGSVKVFL